MQYSAIIPKEIPSKKTQNDAVKLVEKLAGSISIPKQWMGRDTDKIIQEAKKIHFSKKYAPKKGV